MAVFEFTAIDGHHVYKSTWQPFIGEQLQIEREAGNPSDRFAVAVIRVCPSSGTRMIVGTCSQGKSCIFKVASGLSISVVATILDNFQLKRCVAASLLVPRLLMLSVTHAQCNQCGQYSRAATKPALHAASQLQFDVRRLFEKIR